MDSKTMCVLTPRQHGPKHLHPASDVGAKYTHGTDRNAGVRARRQNDKSTPGCKDSSRVEATAHRPRGTRQWRIFSTRISEKGIFMAGISKVTLLSALSICIHVGVVAAQTPESQDLQIVNIAEEMLRQQSEMADWSATSAAAALARIASLECVEKTSSSYVCTQEASGLRAAISPADSNFSGSPIVINFSGANLSSIGGARTKLDDEARWRREPAPECSLRFRSKNSLGLRQVVVVIDRKKVGDNCVDAVNQITTSFIDRNKVYPLVR